MFKYNQHDNLYSGIDASNHIQIVYCPNIWLSLYKNILIQQ